MYTKHPSPNVVCMCLVSLSWTWISASCFRGFFTCIGKDGKVYDELKYVWLQGRQVSLWSGTGSVNHVLACLHLCWEYSNFFFHRCGCIVVCTEPWIASISLKSLKQQKLVCMIVKLDSARLTCWFRAGPSPLPSTVWIPQKLHSMTMSSCFHPKWLVWKP